MRAADSDGIDADRRIESRGSENSEKESVERERESGWWREWGWESAEKRRGHVRNACEDDV